MSQSPSRYTPRRTHRKRNSLRLSSDTTATLPEYTSPIWQRSHNLLELEDSDRPPDYPESAEEADEETDTDHEEVEVVLVPPLSPPPLASPRRFRRYPGAAHRRRQTGSTSDLDTLLQRSVHALEMSNALLQSSMSTQSSLSTLLASDNVVDRSLDRSEQRVSSRMLGTGNLHENWMDDLDEITKGVNGLFGEDGVTIRAASHSAESSGSISQSLPTSSMPSTLARRQHRHRPSMDFRKAATTESAPHLHLSSQVNRTELVAPAPRALTLYVASTDDPESILLPSTLGLRTSSSSHNSDWRTAEPPPPSRSPSTMPYLSLHASASVPVLTDRLMEPSTPAYNLLSSFVTQQPPSPVPSNQSSSSRLPFSFPRRRGSGSTTSTSTERGTSFSGSPSKRALQDSSECHRGVRRGSNSRSRSATPRPMTPPIEELSASSSSSSSDHPHAYRTMQSLRKILDEQPHAPEDKKPERLKAPAFMPRSPMPVASSGTSTATASVSRLLTKSTHHSSTRPPSPPKHSSLKRSSAPPTPVSMTPSPSTSSFPGLLGVGVARLTGSTPSSGLSTPKRISFAELPEPYSSSHPEGSIRFRNKQNRSRSKVKGKGKAKSQADKAREDNGGWWTGWLLGSSNSGSGVGMSAQRHEERIEDRAARSWGGRGGFGGMDEWGV